MEPTSISHRVGGSRPLPQEPTDGEQALTKTSCEHKACRDTPHIEITIITTEGTPSLLEHLTVGPLLAVDHHFPSEHVLEELLVLGLVEIKRRDRVLSRSGATLSTGR